MLMSFAPMEGVTSYIFRRAHCDIFGGADKYYSPFIAPDGSGRFKTGSLRDVLPEHNAGLTLIPQILCNAAEPFLACARQLVDLGYTELNLNAGCPSGTVTAKHKGAGMLSDLRSLDNCLADIFSRCEAKVSIKTRLGMESAEEFPAIMDIYKKYPISELIIHVRARSGMYKSAPDLGAFADALKAAPFPLTYNGDVFSPADLEHLTSAIPGEYGVMLGRGAVANPALFRVLRGGEALTAEALKAFHDRLLEEFLASGLSASVSIARLKELWSYWENMFPDCGRLIKAVYKSRYIEDYTSCAARVFSDCALDQSQTFHL